MRRWILFAELMVLASGLVGCAGNGEEDAKAKLSHPGPPRWPEFPVEIYVDDRIANTPAIESDVLAALNYWETKASRRLFVYRGALASPAAGLAGRGEPT